MLEPPEHRRNERLARGKASELLAAARLMELGHNIALPLLDDDGVDLIVDYRIPVQVKACSTVGKTGNYCFQHFSSLHADYYLFHGVDENAWWVIPRQALEDAGVNAGHRGLSLTGNPRYANTRYSALSVYRDAWHLFGWQHAA